MGNTVAYLMLGFWPLLGIYLYTTKSIQKATFWVVIGGLMYLPVSTAIDLPMLPSIGKNTLPVIVTLIGIWMIQRKKIGFLTKRDSTTLLVLIFTISPFITSILNQDTIQIGSIRVISGLTLYDGLSTLINQLLTIIPFFIGRRFFRTYEQHLQFFKLMALAGLFYTLFMIIEIRLSPQLHNWIYGYFPHSFGQQMRFGGFRPVVFMGHGLIVAFFTTLVVLTVVGLRKNRVAISSIPSSMLLVYLLLMLILCKSFAAILFALLGLIIILFFKTKMQMKIALLIASFVIVYPTMSIFELFPHKTLVEVAESINANRAQSLEFRFEQEEALLERVRERLYFGWGGWGRNRVYDDYWGKDISVTDSSWIIITGQLGIIGFFACFGLIFITQFRASKAHKLLDDNKHKNLLAAHSVIIAMIMLDQTLNSSLAPWTWFIVGILAGRADEVIGASKKTIPASKALRP